MGPPACNSSGRLCRPDRAQSLGQAHQNRNTLIDQRYRLILIKILGDGGYRKNRLAGFVRHRHHCIQCRGKRGPVAPIRPWWIYHEYAGIIARQHRAEHILGAGPIAPDKGMIVQRIGDCDDWPENLAQPLALRRRGGGEFQLERGGKVSDQPGLATGAGNRAQSRANLRPVDMENLQRFKQFGQGVHLCHPGLAQKRAGCRPTPGQRGGMGGGGGARQVGFAGLDAHDTLARRPRRLCHRGECGRIVDPLDIHPDGGHARIVEQRAGQFSQPGLCGIAKAGHIGNRQRACLHRQVDDDV